jgi:hypothetical protein
MYGARLRKQTADDAVQIFVNERVYRLQRRA